MKLLLLSFLDAANQPEPLIVESGTHTGSTMKFLLASFPKARIHTADIKDHGTGLDGFYLGDFAKMLYDRDINNILLAFIDAGPNNDEPLRLKHFEAVLPRMAQGGLIVIDDLMRKSTWNGAPELIARCDLVIEQGRGIGLKYVY